MRDTNHSHLGRERDLAEGVGVDALAVVTRFHAVANQTRADEQLVGPNEPGSRDVADEVAAEITGDDRRFTASGDFVHRVVHDVRIIQHSATVDRGARRGGGDTGGVHHDARIPVEDVAAGAIFHFSQECKGAIREHQSELRRQRVGWLEAADLIIASMQKSISSKKVTYDFARLMEGATQVSCSGFGDVLIENM